MRWSPGAARIGRGQYRRGPPMAEFGSVTTTDTSGFARGLFPRSSAPLHGGAVALIGGRPASAKAIRLLRLARSRRQRNLRIFDQDRAKGPRSLPLSSKGHTEATVARAIVRGKAMRGRGRGVVKRPRRSGCCPNRGGPPVPGYPAGHAGLWVAGRGLFTRCGRRFLKGGQGRRRRCHDRARDLVHLPGGRTALNCFTGLTPSIAEMGIAIRRREWMQRDTPLFETLA